MDRVFDSDSNQSQSAVNRQPLILAVEDNIDNLWLLETILEPYACELIRAADGQSALSLARLYQPDLILLDIILPDMNGLDVIRQLKHSSLTRHIPILAVTGLAKAEDRLELLQAGCEQYISKPYMVDELEVIICRYLKQTPTNLNSDS